MSAYATLRITRSKAVDTLMKEFISSMQDDNRLEFLMDQLLEDRVYNCRIVEDNEENDDEVL